jgi:AraC-like DNA-binding protein
MTVKTISVIRAAYLNVFMNMYGQRCLGSTTLLQGFNLPSNPFEKQDSYLPLKQVLLLVQSLICRTNIEYVLTQFSSRLKITHFSTELQSALQNATSLECALQQFSKLVHHELSNVDCKIQQREDEVHIISSATNMSLSNLDSLEEWLLIMSLLTVIRYFTCDSWTPTKIMLQTRSELGQNANSAFPHTCILTGQAETVMVVPNSLLSLASSRNCSLSTATGKFRLHPDVTAQYNWDFPTTLQKIVQTYLEDGYPAISFIANVIGCSVRSLQRQLKQFNLCYTDIVQQARFNLASHLLNDQRIKIIDVAFAVGYEDPSHFSRAFKRQNGLSPNKYRNLIRTNCCRAQQSKSRQDNSLESILEHLNT